MRDVLEARGGPRLGDNSWGSARKLCNGKMMRSVPCLRMFWSSLHPRNHYRKWRKISICQQEKMYVSMKRNCLSISWTRFLKVKHPAYLLPRVGFGIREKCLVQRPAPSCRDNLQHPFPFRKVKRAAEGATSLRLRDPNPISSSPFNPKSSRYFTLQTHEREMREK